MVPGTVNLKLKRKEDFLLDVSFTLPQKGVTVLFGPSGCGKTTILRCLAGLERAEGQVVIGNECWQDSATRQFIPTYKRSLGYVFQEASLLPHMTARENIVFAQRRAKHPLPETVFRDLLERLGIVSLLDMLPSRLSGGERQRVALARALSTNPSILLMDEPLSALDQERKLEFLPWLEHLKREVNTPIVYVTHSSEEMFRLADFIVLLEKGKIVDTGCPTEVIYRQGLRASNEEASSVLRAVVKHIDSTWMTTHVALNDQVSLEVPCGHDQRPVGDAVRLRVFAQDVSVTLEAAQHSSIRNILPATIVGIRESVTPANRLLELQVGEQRLLALVTAHSVHDLALSEGLPVFAQIKAVTILT